MEGDEKQKLQNSLRKLANDHRGKKISLDSINHITKKYNVPGSNFDEQQAFVIGELRGISPYILIDYAPLLNDLPEQELG